MTDNSSDTPNGVGTDVGEPSMEDILASIRRIIAEDDETDNRHLDTNAANVIDPKPSSVVDIDDISLSSLLPDTDFGSASSKDAIVEPNDEEEDILVLDQLVNDNGKAKELTGIETEELIIDGDSVSEDFNPVSSVVSDLEDRLSSDRVIEERIELTERKSDMPAGLVFSNAFDDLVKQDKNLNQDKDLELSLTGELETVSDDEIEELIGDVQTESLVTRESVESDVEMDLEQGDDGVFDLDDGESDLDIVKSLMADLADTSFLDDDMLVSGEGAVEAFSDMTSHDIAPVETLDTTVDDVLNDLTSADIESNSAVADDPIDDILADLGMDLVEAEPTKEMESLDLEPEEVLDIVVAEENRAEEEQDQILNEILELTIEDEEAELKDELTLAVEETALEELSETTEDNPLLQIAAEAEADAGAIDGPALMGSGIGAAVATNAAALSKDEDRIEMTLPPEDGQSTEEILNELDLALAEVAQEDSQDEVSDPEPEPEPEVVAETEADATDQFVEPEEAEDMPKAARKDAIINEVTEEATVDAFAELSQAVEDKAVFTESGPRIGDIVQDALRPMLKEWLDENLKGIVERAVAKEVKRISSGK